MCVTAFVQDFFAIVKLYSRDINYCIDFDKCLKEVFDIYFKGGI